jgi:hypothetical protein
MNKKKTQVVNKDPKVLRRELDEVLLKIEHIDQKEEQLRKEVLELYRLNYEI